MQRLIAPVLLASCLAACQPAADDGRPPSAREFPRAYRGVSAPAGSSVSSEKARDDRREAETVMELADIRPGMTLADLGAGEGYYTVRLADRVGPRGRVLAEDIDPGVRRRLADRVERERLDNVSVQLGTVDNPKLPENSFDRIFMVHMYHEVAEPYAFLWNMRSALREGGKVIVVEVDGPPSQHGLEPKLLFCEFDHVGFRLEEFVRKPELAGYYAQFVAEGLRPEPQDIEPCSQPGDQN
ncbi:methyltransferase domain-containing protein [Altererythrobacter sp. B11]|uniref:methyltransferase domain-containing protein n=1 Tax=Altererythrobacter sp. B11 TaxID=2060312 RepID=UPI000E5B5D10|nr:methyltransferase domain-containing protein [Altererythrobacter sp. B11]